MFSISRLTALFLALAFTLSSCGNKPADTAATTATTPSTTATTPATTADPLADFLTKFKAAAAADSPKAMLDLCEFPLTSGQSQSDFMTDFDMYFDKTTADKIQTLKVEDFQDSDGGKKATLQFVDNEGKDNQTESSASYTIIKKDETYKLVAISVAG
jgi:hypothetical protein